MAQMSIDGELVKQVWSILSACGHSAKALFQNAVNLSENGMCRHEKMCMAFEDKNQVVR